MFMRDTLKLQVWNNKRGWQKVYQANTKQKSWGHYINKKKRMLAQKTLLKIEKVIIKGLKTEYTGKR